MLTNAAAGVQVRPSSACRCYCSALIASKRKLLKQETKCDALVRVQPALNLGMCIHVWHSIQCLHSCTFTTSWAVQFAASSAMAPCLVGWTHSVATLVANFTLKQLLTDPSCSTLINSAVTVHHLALLYIGLYSLSTDMLSTYVLSDVVQTKGCLADSDVGATVCMLTQGNEGILKKRTGCVRFANRLRNEYEQRFLFSCPAYSDDRQNYASLFQ